MSPILRNIAVLLLYLLFLTIAGAFFIPMYLVLLFVARRQNRRAQRYTYNPAIWLLPIIGVAALLHVAWAINHPLPIGYPNQNELIGALFFKYAFGAFITWGYSLWWRRVHPLQQSQLEARANSESVS